MPDNRNSGWDFYNNDESVYDNYLYDYHGTFVTSIIVGEHTKDNKVWGIAPDVKIVPLKFMEGSKGSIEDAISAIEYAHNIGVSIINMSWDSPEYNDKLLSALKKYNDILFITSTGKSNTNLEISKIYPC